MRLSFPMELQEGSPSIGYWKLEYLEIVLAAEEAIVCSRIYNGPRLI